MRIPLRPIIGFGAGATAMALVLLAGLTAPRAEPVQQANAKCPDSGHEIPLAAPVDGAQNPA
jgi:hypothetical protein